MHQRMSTSPRIKPLPMEHSPAHRFELLLEVIGADDRRRMGPRRNGRWRPQAPDRACREPSCRISILHGAYRRRHASLRGRRQETCREWEYRTSPLYGGAERVSLDFTAASASVPSRPKCLPNCASIGAKSKSSKSSV